MRGASLRRPTVCQAHAQAAIFLEPPERSWRSVLGPGPGPGPGIGDRGSGIGDRGSVPVRAQQPGPLCPSNRNPAAPASSRVSGLGDVTKGFASRNLKSNRPADIANPQWPVEKGVKRIELAIGKTKSERPSGAAEVAQFIVIWTSMDLEHGGQEYC
ncbi:hypothetical protein chiPu_0013045 [Chiloscyllium punctatum]|uniref:Uncharacterized protein n=1 Tax=Chiloscyllium punctatum TaxID=137246 RepID=A0A401SW17_CHIPU|nr:hypothetical protein [Chiloscyllium punctatum]